MSKAIWGHLKEPDLEVTWANLFPKELPPDGNLGLVSWEVLPGCPAAWELRALPLPEV